MISLSNLRRPLTPSMGISVVHGTDIEAEMLIQQAYLALYEAKRTGRNRICVFEDKRSINEKTVP